MANFFRWCHISSNFLLEANVVIFALGCVFLLDLINHISLKRSTLEHVNTSFYLCLGIRVFVFRTICILGHLASGVLGIFIARTLTIFRFVTYIILAGMTLIYTLAIGVSPYVFEPNRKYFSNLMLHDLWMRNRIEPLEDLFDCCGKHGAIDYKIANRSWSKASCCGLPNCVGCQDMFYDFLNSFEMEMARDNIILFVILFIALVLMIVHFNNLELEEDPYLSEDEDEIEISPESSTSRPR